MSWRPRYVSEPVMNSMTTPTAHTSTAHTPTAHTPTAHTPTVHSPRPFLPTARNCSNGTYYESATLWSRCCHPTKSQAASCKAQDLEHSSRPAGSCKTNLCLAAHQSISGQYFIMKTLPLPPPPLCQECAFCPNFINK